MPYTPGKSVGVGRKHESRSVTKTRVALCSNAQTPGHNRTDACLRYVHDDIACGKQEGCGLADFSGFLLQRREEDGMEPSTKYQAQGKFHEVKGKIKEKLGKATQNPNLENEGATEKTAG
jgi:hypothetical protein